MSTAPRHAGARPRLSGRRAAATLLAAALLASCSVLQRQPPAPVEQRGAPAPAASAALPPPPGTIERAHARWVPASFAELPGWGQDRVAELWPALRLSCGTPPLANGNGGNGAPPAAALAEGWAAVCAQSRQFFPADDAQARQWIEQRFKVYRVESLEGDPNGLATGYFEPLVEASRRPTRTRRVPLYGPPADLGQRRPYWTRQELDTLPAAQAGLKGREIAYVEDPLDALVLQVQGSGRLKLSEADGSVRLLRLAFAGHNDHPYRSVGRWLIDQGELAPGEASWPAIKDWARRNPRRINEALWQNPRTVFFREEALPDPALGPKGAQGVPLTPGRSIAVDPLAVPYGTPVWMDATEPLSARPLQRLVMAQDTGGAIVGAVRADYFWGWGDEAEAQAGRMKQPLRAWALWPR
ncbi:murein transglycosylase A [Ideonella sp.]|uniref:murein transglycosylase A n=1 Tax=Ideonella sp. TaxID=1929293 RepID=UPI002B477BD9|nr:MltA domain-containing protein [Ideonella sp.]HJV68934.1 MltA domain-containing protein [Ideonella sp.]